MCVFVCRSKEKCCTALGIWNTKIAGGRVSGWGFKSLAKSESEQVSEEVGMHHWWCNQSRERSVHPLNGQIPLHTKSLKLIHIIQATVVPLIYNLQWQQIIKSVKKTQTQFLAIWFQSHDRGFCEYSCATKKAHLLTWNGAVEPCDFSNQRTKVRI